MEYADAIQRPDKEVDFLKMDVIDTDPGSVPESPQDRP